MAAADTGCSAENPPTEGWCSCYTRARPDTVHVHPLGDVMEHEATGDTSDCPCGPTVEPVMRPDGSNGWLVIHHALDGRPA